MTSRHITEEIVRMNFDARTFEKDVSRSIGVVEKLKLRLNFSKSIDNMAQLDRASNAVDFGGMSKGIDIVAGRMSAMGIITATVLQNMTNGVLTATKSLINTAILEPIRGGMREFELQMGSIQTILANTSHNGTVLTDVTAALDELNSYADRTIYNFGQMTDSIGKFTAAGVDLETSTAAIKGIANLAAVSGSNAQQASNAMYQLSQAISSGTVRLMDWNSVVNAGMGGKVFQDALIDTARIGNASIDSIIETAGGFRGSLEKEWLTSQVLLDTLAKFTGDVTEAQLEAIGYTQEEITAIIKMGEVANDAATKVKTFSQLKDTMAEAVESGWSQTWRLILGDFDQAKELFTGISSVLDDLISASADSRNSMVEGWNKSGGRDLAIRALMSSLEILVQMSETIKEGLNEIFPPATSIRLVRITRSVLNLVESFKMGAAATHKFKRIVMAIAAVFDIIKMAVFAVVSPIASFSKTLGPATDKLVDMSMLLANVVLSFRNFAKETNFFGEIVGKVMGGLGERSDKFKRIFAGLTAILDIGKSAIYAIGVSLGIFSEKVEIVGKVGSAADGILDFIANIADGAVALRDFLSSNDTFAEVLKRAGTSIFSFASGAKELLESIREFSLIKVIVLYFRILKQVLKDNGLDWFNAGVEKASIQAKALGDWIRELKDKFLELKIFKDIDSYFAGLDSSDLISFIEKINEKMVYFSKTIHDGKLKVDAFFTKLTKMKNAFLDLFVVVEKPTKEIEKFVAVASLDGVEGKLGIFAGIWEGISAAISDTEGALAELSPTMADIAEKAKPYIGKLFDAFTDMASNFTFDQLLTALGVGLLVAISSSIKTLASGSWLQDILNKLFRFDKVDDVLGALTSLFDGVRGSLETWQQSIRTEILLKIAYAIAIITASVTVLSMIDREKLALALGAVTVMVIELFGSGGAFGKINVSGAAQTAITVLAMATAILILSFAVAKFAGIDVATMSTGLTAAGVGIGALVLATKGLSATGGVGILKTSLAMIGLGAALFVLSFAVRAFGEMDYDTLSQGLAAVGVSLAAFAIFSQAINEKQLAVSAVAIGVLGYALSAMSIGVSDMGAISWDSMLRGIVGLAGVLAVLVVSMKLLPLDMPIKAAALIVVAGAIQVLGDILVKLSGLSWDEVARGLAALGGSLLILTVALYAMSGTAAGAAALVVASVGVLAISYAMEKLGALSWDDILRGLAALAGVLVVLGLGALILTPLVPVMIALGAAMLLMGIGAGAMGVGVFMAASGLVLLAGAAATVSGAIMLVGSAIISLLPALAEAMAMGAVRFIEAIGNYAPALFEAAKKLILGFLDAVVEVGPAIVTSIVTLIMQLLDVIVENLPTFIEQGYFILKSLLQGIADNIEEIVTLAGEITVNFILGLANSIPDLIDASFAFILSFIDGLTLAVEEYMPLLMISINGLGLALVEGFIAGVTGGFTDVWASVTELGEGTLDAFRTVFDMHSPSKKTEKMGEDTTAGFAGGLIANNKAIMDAVSGIALIVLDALTGKNTEFYALGVEYADELTAGFLTQFEFLIPALLAILTKFIYMIQAYQSRFNKVGVLLAFGLMDGVAVGLTSRIPEILAILRSLLQQIEMYAPEFYRVGQILMLAFVQGIVESQEVMDLTIADMLDAILITITSKESAFYLGGKNLSNAVAKGISDGTAAAVAAAAAMADAVTQAAAGAWDIHSPSRVFLKLTGYIEQAVVMGLDKARGPVGDASTRMADSVQNGMGLVIDSIDEAMARDLSFAPVIKPVLDMGDVTTGLASLRRSFDSTPTTAFTGSLTAQRKTYSDTTPTTETTSGSGDTFVQHLHSPKALDQPTIYRQTKSLMNRRKKDD